MRTLAIVLAASLLCAACDQIRALAPPREYNGAYVVIEADRPAIDANHLEDMSEQAGGVLRAAGIRYSGRGVSEGVLRIRLENPADTERATQALAPITGHLVLSNPTDGVIEARVSNGYADSLVNQTTEQSAGIIERRLPSGALVQPYGPGRLVVRTDQRVASERLLRAVSQRGQLAFHLVKEVTPEQIEQGRTPVGAVLAQPYFDQTQPEFVVRRASLVGHIERADRSIDPQTGEFVVSFTFDPEGARVFCQITREHTGKRFAVLLDGRVLTAPTIAEPICGGSGQISGNFDADSADELAIFLRAGALPVPFTVVAQGVGVPAAP